MITPRLTALWDDRIEQGAQQLALGEQLVA